MSLNFSIKEKYFWFLLFLWWDIREEVCEIPGNSRERAEKSGIFFTGLAHSKYPGLEQWQYHPYYFLYYAGKILSSILRLKDKKNN